MITRRHASVVGAALAVGALFGGHLTRAAPAHADVHTYLQALHNAGINREESEELEMGWEVCALRDLGVPPERVQDQAVQNSRTYPPDGMTLEQAGQIVRIAVDELCNKRLSPKPVAPTSRHQDGKSADLSDIHPLVVPGADRSDRKPQLTSAAERSRQG